VSRELRALLLIAFIFAVGFVGYQVLFGDGLGDRFRIVTVAGEVEHVRANGEADQAVEGSVLREGDRIRSGDGGTAVLGLGEDTRISVDSTTTLEVLGVTADGVQIELEGGRVRATVRPGSGSVGVTADGKRVSATDADFDVARDGNGNFAVSSTRGELSIEGVGGVDNLAAGVELVVPNGGAPVRAPASDALLLHVALPPRPRTRETRVEITGETQPGSRVEVTGGAGAVTTSADPSGRFVVSVPLAEGKNALVVRAKNALGREATVVTAEIERDTTAPSVGVSLEY
jgi:hypothetical protein